MRVGWESIPEPLIIPAPSVCTLVPLPFVPLQPPPLHFADGFTSPFISRC